jgi:hypothetical protein
MKRFYLAIAGSFIGKILAVLAVSICIAIGFGPDKWASWILDATPGFLQAFRWPFRIAAIVGVLLIASWFAAKAPFLKAAFIWLTRRLRKYLTRVRKRLRYWTTRTYRYWQFVGPNDYEVLRSTRAVDWVHFASFENDRIEFAHRFADAFPGARWLLTLQGPPNIIPRLDVLLRWPLSAASPFQEHYKIPFYWNCGAGNMHITRYHRYKRDIVLVNEMEIRPTFLAAVGGDVYWQTYVYLEGAAFEPRQIRGEENYKLGEYQEYAIYEGKVFNRTEYDDGSYVHKGRPVRFRRPPDLRSRQLVPFGMLIIPNSSPANNPNRDKAIRAHIARVIADKDTMKSFAQYLMSLPKE